MEEAHSLFFVRELLILLTIMGVIVPILYRFKISAVLGYLLCGILIGPYGLSAYVEDQSLFSYIVIVDDSWVKYMAEFGVMLLMFMIGLELSLTWLMKMKRVVLGMGSLQIVFCATVIGIAAYYFGNSVRASLLLGASLALSSTAIVVELLKEHRLMKTKVGKTSFSILLMQDLAVVPIIILLTMFAEHGTETEQIIGTVFYALFKAAAAVCIIYIIGRRLIRPILAYVDESDSEEWFISLVLLLVVSTATITNAFGLSLTLGAFLAGLLISETEYRDKVESIVLPLKGIFMGIFFLSVGMMIDLREIARMPFWILTSVFGIYALKSAAIFILCLFTKLKSSQAIHVALMLGQSGEFAFLIVGLSVHYGMLNAPGGQFFLIVTALTMFLTPFAMHLAKYASQRLEAKT